MIGKELAGNGRLSSKCGARGRQWRPLRRGWAESVIQAGATAFQCRHGPDFTAYCPARVPPSRERGRATGMPRFLKFQFVRFLFVGTLNTIVGYAAYALLLYLGLPYAAASFGALLLGILFSFRTHGSLVFGNRDGRLIFRFAACWGIIYLVNIALIGGLTRLGLSDYVAGALTMLPVALLSYLMQKFLVFEAAGTHRTSQ